MRPSDPDERIPVRVKYVPRGYGLALTICDDAAEPGREVPCLDLDDVDCAATDNGDDGFLTVIESGVTTLELRRPDGGSSYLIWDQAEVAWESLRAG